MRTTRENYRPVSVAVATKVADFLASFAAFVQTQV